MSGANTPHSDYVGGLFRARLSCHPESSANAEDITAEQDISPRSVSGYMTRALDRCLRMGSGRDEPRTASCRSVSSIPM